MPKKPRVVIPTDPSAVISLLKSIRTKHLEDAVHSPLNNLNWPVISAALDRADDHDAAAEESRLKMEKEFRERDTDMPVVEQAVRSARDILLAVHANNPKKLGDWKLEVNDTVAKAKPSAT